MKANLHVRFGGRPLETQVMLCAGGRPYVQGVCPVCGTLITKETGSHHHHIQWRIHDGKDELENRMLLHPNCHRQIHSPDYNGPLPRSPIKSVRDA